MMLTASVAVIACCCKLQHLDGLLCKHKYIASYCCLTNRQCLPWHSYWVSSSVAVSNKGHQVLDLSLHYRACIARLSAWQGDIILAWKQTGTASRGAGELAGSHTTHLCPCPWLCSSVHDGGLHGHGQPLW